jgi:hypothetical protein
MADQRPTNKAELIKEIDRTWPELNTALDRLTETQMTTIRDAEGWTVKDHITHIAAWERSVVFFLQGKPRHEGLGVGEKLYLEDDDDINAVIQRQTKDLASAEARTQLRDVHGQLLNLLQPLSDEDLQKPYRHYLPDEPGEGEGPMVFFVIYGNTAGHFEEHLGWIEALAGRSNQAL